MNPDVVAAIARLRADNVLSAPQATLFNRVARRHLVSVRLEIRLLLYIGVLLLTSGVGVLVVEHQKEIGPLAIAGALSLGTLICLAWVVRTAPPFSWRSVESPNVAFDYILLLGVLLFASALGYVEAQFTVLGERWAHHLLIVGVIYFLAAYRWDSRTVLGLALTTLAAWRGVSMSLKAAASLGIGHGDDLRANAIVIGLIYVALAVLSVRLERKSHFEDVFGNTGLILLLGALVSGVFNTVPWGIWLAALLAVAVAVMWLAFGLGRSLYFAEGVVAAYLGLLRPLFHMGMTVGFLLAALLGAGALALIIKAHRRMVER
jgi:hypothetical protein